MLNFLNYDITRYSFRRLNILLCVWILSYRLSGKNKTLGILSLFNILDTSIATQTKSLFFF